jgi:hypothetical protein
MSVEGNASSTYELKGKLSSVFSNIIDNTLSIEGAGADAKATGDAIKGHSENKNNPHGVTAEQVGARPDTWIPTAAQVGARPDTWTPTAAQVGALPTTGGTLTGALTTTEVNVADDSWPMVNLRNVAGKKLGMVSVDTSSNRLCFGQQETGASYYEGYLLPARTSGLTASKFYTILTSKNATDYVVAQGTSGGWNYQKWNSKYVTAWRNITTTPTVQGVNYVTQALPFTLANTNYYVGVTGVSSAMSGFATDFNVSNSTPSEGRTTTNVTINYNYSRSSFYSVGMTVFIMGTLPK